MEAEDYDLIGSRAVGEEEFSKACIRIGENYPSYMVVVVVEMEVILERKLILKTVIAKCQLVILEGRLGD